MPLIEENATPQRTRTSEVTAHHEIFDPKFVEYDVFCEKLENWFSANDILNSKKSTIFLSKLNNETYKILRDLVYPDKLDTKEYDTLQQTLNKYYSKTVVVYKERDIFYKLEQKQNEPMNEWNARIKHTASTCKFGSGLESVLRDKFVTGLLPGPIKDRLFEESDTLKYAEAVDLASKKEGSIQSRTSERVHYVSNNRHGHGSQSNGTNSRSNTNSTRNSATVCAKCKKTGHETKNCYAWDKKCEACGRNNHFTNDCVYKTYTCDVCKKKGHIKYACRQRKSVNNIMVENAKDPVMVDIWLNDTAIQMEIDTGSPISAMSDDLFHQLFDVSQLKATDLILSSYNGKSIKTIGKIEVMITANNKTRAIEFQVIEHGGHPLLGRDFLKGFQIELMGLNYVSTNTLNLDEILQRNKDIFNGEQGTFKYAKVKLHMPEFVRPIFCKPRQLPIAIVDAVNIQLEK